MTPECCIYGIREKTETSYFYVGSTKHSAEARFKTHIKDVKRKRHVNKHFQNKVSFVGASNVTVDVLEEVSTQNRFTAEYQWINKLINAGHPLTNRRLNPWPHEVVVPEWTPNKFAHYVFLALLAPEVCEIPENQPLYSACRAVARKIVLSMLKDNKREVLHFLKTGEMPA